MIRISNAWPYNVIHWVFFFFWLVVIDYYHFFFVVVARFIIGFFIGGLPWYLGAFILLFVRVDYREKPGYVACTVAVSVLLCNISFFSCMRMLSIYFIFFLDDSMYWYELQCIVLLVAIIDLWDWSYLLKLAIYAYFLNLWLVLWHSSRKK